MGVLAVADDQRFQKYGHLAVTLPSPAAGRAAKQAAERGLSRYADQTFGGTLRRVTIVGVLLVHGVPAVGLYEPNDGDGEVFLATSIPGDPDLSLWSPIEQTLHHELSSWVYDQIAADRLASLDFAKLWRATLPRSFRYEGDWDEERFAELPGWTEDPDEMLWEQGFVDEYARTSMENDFNSIAERCFVSSPHFIASLTRPGRIRSKARLVSAAYRLFAVSFPCEIREMLRCDDVAGPDASTPALRRE